MAVAVEVAVVAADTAGAVTEAAEVVVITEIINRIAKMIFESLILRDFFCLIVSKQGLTRKKLQRLPFTTTG
jgi:hypothetical protein